MKLITIFRENSERFQISDNDSSPLSDYSERLSKLFEVGNVVILETSEGNVILRPNKIDFIHVIEDGIVSEETIVTAELNEDVVTEEEV